MYVAVWRYRVAPAERARFEENYGPAGAWATLFARQAGFIGTELLKGEDGSYVTLDRWEDEAAWEAFRREHGEAYRMLDSEMEALTLEEERIGGFSA